MKFKFSHKLFLISLIVVVLILFFYLVIDLINKEEVHLDINEKTYQNKELGFSFSYPVYWGNAREEYLKNTVLGFKGRVFGIEFIRQEDDLRVTPGISEDYFITPMLQAFSKDYEVYETLPLFSEHYNYDVSSLEFCQKFVEKTLANLGCQEKIINGQKIATATYPDYIAEGMMGSGEEIYFEESAFIPLAAEEFPGLEARIQIYSLEDESLKFKNKDDLRKLARIELEKILNDQASVYSQKKINEFKRFIQTFSFE